MENSNEINRKIAENLTKYRKAANLTQAELAEKINYSDKSVSKWESANGVPDVYTLLQIAKLFGVTLNDLVGEEAPVKEVQEPTPEENPKKRGMHVLIMLLASGIVWLVATCLFVLWQLFFHDQGDWWIMFIYALPVNAIVLIVLSAIWKYRILSLISVSVLVWTAITCVYLTVRSVAIEHGYDYSAFWCVYLLGAPLQVLEFLWTFFRSSLVKNKKKKEKKAEKSVSDAEASEGETGEVKE